MKDIRIILDNIRSVQNTASIFRTADCLGATHIYCIGTTPTPIDRFGRPKTAFSKVSLGAEKSMKWSYAKSAAPVIRKLKKDRFTIVAIEQSPQSVGLGEVAPKKVPPKVALIFGNEVDGVSNQVLKMADFIAEIPMKGSKESLNVSVAAGIALHEFS